MIQSMTGYGRAEAVCGDKKFTVEVRSVNGKSLDLSLRTPSAYRATESQIRSLATTRIIRGKSDLSIQVETPAIVEVQAINRDAFRAHYKELLALSREVGYDMDTEPMIATILRMPNVFDSGPKAEATSDEIETLIKAVNVALDAFAEFRTNEGGVLIADLLERIDTIGRLLVEVEPYEAERIETVRARLAENLEKARVTVDNNRFEAEIIYYLEKFDVTEEKVRLTQHLKYFREVALDGGDAGRKLGFIAQEIGREINTLGSKANHHEMQRIVVGMKDELEKIKEQLLNIL